MPTYGTTLKKVRDTALDLGVYLPVGATLKARDLLLSKERLEETYRATVDRGRDTLGSAIGRQKPKLERVKVGLKDEKHQAKQAFRGSAERARQRTESSIRSTAARAGAAPSVGELPIEKYDEATAQEITSRLNGLTVEELIAVRAYERGHQNRSTILQAIEPKLVELPIVGYDDLTVDEVVGRLSDLSEPELRTIRDYESRTRGRKTILERIEVLIAA